MVMRGITLALALILVLPAGLLAAQVTAVTDRDRLGSGESLQLELRVTGSPDGDPDLAALEQDWEILNRSQSSQMQVSNGSFSRSFVLNLTLMPRRSGELEIPAVCFGGDCSLPMPITISAQAAALTAAPLLLEAELQPQQVPVGAQIILTLRLLHRVDLAQASLSTPQPEGVEAEIRQLGKDRTTEVNRDGYRYRMIERRYALFPHQSGQLRIPPLQLDAQIDAGSARRDLFGRSLQQVRQRTEPLQIQVTEPPADLGVRHWLPAQRLTLQDDWHQQPPTLRVGEPATRTLTLTAEGLPAASLPELKLAVPAGWKSYPDQPSRQDSENQAGIVGTMQQKLALVPTRSGPLELPAVDLDWYDVAAGSWQRIHLPALTLEVAPAAAGSAANFPASQPAAAPLVPAAPTAAPAADAAAGPSPAAPAVETTPGFWPWLSLALGLGWFTSLMLCWWRRRKPAVAKTTAPTSSEQLVTEQVALKAVLESAGRNDPQATRQALRRWSRLRFPEAAGQELAALVPLGGPPLADALAELDAVLYGSTQANWTGAKLCAALKKLPRQQRKVAESLPPLYPAG